MLAGFPAFSKDISAVQYFLLVSQTKEEAVFSSLFPLSLRPINRSRAQPVLRKIMRGRNFSLGGRFNSARLHLAIIAERRASTELWRSTPIFADSCRDAGAADGGSRHDSRELVSDHASIRDEARLPDKISIYMIEQQRRL